MKNEMDPLIGNYSWGLTKLREAKKVLHNKWIYWVKNKQDGSKRHMARLVGKDMSTKDVTYDKLGLCTISVDLIFYLEDKGLSCEDQCLEFEDRGIYTWVEQFPNGRLLGYGVCFWLIEPIFGMDLLICLCFYVLRLNLILLYKRLSSHLKELYLVIFSKVSKIFATS